MSFMRMSFMRMSFMTIGWDAANGMALVRSTPGVNHQVSVCVSRLPAHEQVEEEEIA